MKNTLIALIFIIFTITNIIKVEAKEFFTLDKSIKTALLQNAELKSLKHETDHYKHEVGEVRSALLPNISLNWEHYFVDEKTEAANRILIPDATAASGYTQLSPLKPYTSTYVKLTQSVINIPLWRNYTASIKNKISYEYKYEAAKQELAYNVIESYINVLKVKEIKKIKEAELKLAKRKLKAAKHFVSVGLKHRTKILKQRVALVRAQKKRDRVDKDYTTAILNFNNLLGRKADLEIKLLPLETNYNPNEINKFFPIKLKSNPDLYLKEITEKSLNVHPVIRQLTAINAAAKDVYSSAKYSYVPQIGFEARYGYGTSVFDHLNSFGWFTIIKASMPIIDGLKSRASIQKTKDDVKKTEGEFLKTKNDIIQNISLCLTDLTSAKKQMEVAYHLYKEVRENYRITSHRYKLGLVSPIELKEMKKIHQETKLNKVYAYYDFILSKNKYLKALGILNTSKVAIFFPKTRSSQ